MHFLATTEIRGSELSENTLIRKPTAKHDAVRLLATVKQFSDFSTISARGPTCVDKEQPT